MPSWKKLVTSGSNAVFNHVTASGNISGSSTSTGSFGHVITNRVQTSTLSGKSPLVIDADNLKLNASGTLSGSSASTASFGILKTANDFIVDSNGRVGINTTSPDYKLDVAGNIGMNEYLYHNGDSDTYIQFMDDRIYINAGGDSVIDYDEDATSTLKLAGGGEADVTIGDSTTFFVGGSQGSYDAKVGIGTSTPGYALDVSGTIRALGGNIFLSGANSIKNVNNALLLDAATSQHIDLRPNNGSVALRANSVGRVGIGETSSIPSRLSVATGSATAAVVKARSTATNARASYQIGNDADNWYMGIDGGNSDAFFIADVVDSSDRLVITQAGNVGIGTSSPVSLLHIEGDTAQLTIRDDSSYSAGTGGKISFQGNDGNGNVKAFAVITGVSKGANNGELLLQTRNAGTLTTAIAIDDTQNVGIGVTDPDSKLEVQGSDLLANFGGTNAGFYIRNNTANYISFQGYGSDGFIFKDGGNERVRIEADGDVGIGTSSPGRKLEVSSGGADSPMIRASYDSNNYLDIKHDVINAVKSSGENLNLQTGGTTAIHIDASQNVGIGTSSPSYELDISAASGDVEARLYRNANVKSSLRFQNSVQHWEIGNSVSVNNEFSIKDVTDSRTPFHIDTAGLVGIGTTNPDLGLHVYGAGNSGRIKLQQTTAADYSLISYVTTTRQWNVGVGGNAGVASLQNNFFFQDVTSGANALILNNTTGDAIFGGDVSGSSTSTGSFGHLVIGSDSTTFKNLSIGSLTTSGNILTSHASAPSITATDTTNTTSIQMRATDSEVRFGSVTNHPVKMGANSSTTGIVIDTSNNIGIGTSSPSHLLHIKRSVAGHADLTLESTDNTYVSYLKFATNGNDWQIAAGGSSHANFPNKFYIYDSTNTAARLVIDSSGKVGIGTSSPGDILDLKASDPHLAMIDSSDSDKKWRVGVANNQFRIQEDGVATPFKIYESSVDNSLVIDGDGNVGIGTSSPTFATGGGIHLKGSSSAFTSLRISVDSNTGVDFSSDSNGHGYMYNRDNSALIFGTNNTERMRILNSGNVGIGTSSASGPLHVYHATTNGVALFESGDGQGGIALKDDSTSNNVFLLATGDDFGIQTGGVANRLTVKSDGKVGIGTTSPGSSLDVAGEIRGQKYAFNDDTNTHIDTFAADQIGFTLGGNSAVRWAYVAGAVTQQFMYGASATYPSYTFQSDQDTGMYLATNGAIGFSTGASERMRINSTGLGIGTASPSAKLHVDGDAIVTGKITAQEFHTEFVSASIQFSSGSTKFGDTNDDLHQFTGSIRIQRGDDVALQLMRGSQNVAYLGDVGSGNDGGVIAYDENGALDLLIRTKDAQNSYLNTTGNFGFGTNSPGNKIHIVQNNSDDYSATGDDYANAILRLHNSNTSATTPHSLIHFRLDKNGGDGYLGFITEGSTGNVEHFVLGNQTDNEILRVASGGNVGIGTTSPSHPLDVAGVIRTTGIGTSASVRINNTTNSTGNEWQLYSYNNGDFSIYQDGASDRLYINSNGKVGIGTTSPTKTSHVNFTSSDTTVATGEGLAGGAAGTGLLIQNATDSTGVYANLDFRAGSADARIAVQKTNTNAGDMHFIMDNTNSPASMMVIKNDGKVGIGTTSPSTKLDVAGSGAFSGIVTHSSTSNFVGNVGIGSIAGAAGGKLLFVDAADGLADNNDVARFRNQEATAGRNYGVSIIAGSNSTDNSLHVMDKSSNSSLIVKGDGNVGIGTTSPATKLHLADSSHTYLTLESTHASTAAEVALKYSNSTTSTSYWWVGMNDANSANYSIAYGTAFSNGNTVFMIDSDGDVGIGTTSPSEKLEVAGGIAFSGTATMTEGNDFGKATIDTDGTDRMRFHINGTNNAVYGGYEFRQSKGDHSDERLVMLIDETGKVGIGISAADGRLHVSDGLAGSVTAHADADELVIENSGNAGISILTPATSNGAIYFGDPQDNNIGMIDYDHALNKLSFTAGATTLPVFSVTSNTAEFGPTIMKVSGSAISTGSFGRLEGDGSGLTGVTATAGAAGNQYNVQFNSNGSATGGSDNFVFNSSTNRVGIGESSPDEALHITSTAASATPVILLENSNANNLAPQINLYKNSASPAANDYVGQIDFEGNDSGDNRTQYARIIAEANVVTNSNEDGILDLQVARDGSLTTALRLRGMANGAYVGIGETNPESPLHIKKASAGSVTANANAVLTLEDDGTNVLQFLSPSDQQQQIRFGDTSDDGAGILSYNHSTNAMQFATAGPIKMTLDGSGNLGIGVTSNDSNTKFQIEGSNASNQDYVFRNNHSTAPSRVIVNSNDTGVNAQLVADAGNSFAWVGSSTGGTNRVVFPAGSVGYFDGSRFGVRVPSPESILDISGSAQFGQLQIRDGSGSIYRRFYVSASGAHGLGTLHIQSRAFPGSGTGDVYTHFKSSVSGGTTRMNVLVDGKVGIGTTSPAYKMHISSSDHLTMQFDRAGQETYRLTHGTSGLFFTKPNSTGVSYGVTQDGDFHTFNAAGNAMFRSDASNSNVDIGYGNLSIGNLKGDSITTNTELAVYGGEGGDAILQLLADNADNTADYFAIRQLASGNLTMGHHTGGGFNDALVIGPYAGGNNVGIGTSSPGEKLDVDGDIRVRGAGGSIGGTTIGNAALIIGSTTNGIGVDANELLKKGGDLYFGVIDDDDIFFRANSSTRMFIQSGTGNVGIGAGTPTELLHVQGNIKAEGDVIAENFIVKSTVTQMTQSFSSGSTIFGDTQDDTHQFTGSLSTSGSLTVRNNAINILMDYPAGGSAQQFAQLNFGDTGDADNGYIRYDHGNEAMSFAVGAQNHFKIQTTGQAALVKGGNATNTATEGTFHVHTATAGSVSAGTSADDLVVENSGDAGISVLSPDSNSARIQFGSPSDNDIGHIGGFYNSGNEYLFFNVGGSQAMVIDANQKVGIGTTSPSDYDSGGDNLVIYENGHSGITIASGTSSNGSIHFADGTSGNQSYRGIIAYSHSSEVLQFATVGANNGYQLKLDQNSKISLSNNDSGTSNTIFGKNAGLNLDAGSNYNVFIGEEVSDATMADAINNVGIGYQALSNVTTTDDNVAIGFQAGTALRTGNKNVIIGSQAGHDMDNSQFNVVIGDQAMANEVNGDRNTAVGYHALYSQDNTGTEITENVALGAYAGFYNVTGTKNTYLGTNAGFGASAQSNSSNVGLGYNALNKITTGTENVSVGKDSMLDNTSGAGNTAVGTEALANNTTAGENVAIGKLALYTNSTTGANTAVGYTALRFNTAANNTAVGHAAFYSNSSGTGNVGLGVSAGYANTTGLYNTAVGFEALKTNVDGDSNTAIGRRALYTFEASSDGDGENTAVGALSALSLTTGVGNTSIGKQALCNATTAGYNVAVGVQAIGLGTATAASGYNTAVGNTSLYDLTSGTGNVALGAEAAMNITTGHQNTVVGRQALATATNSSNIVAVGLYAGLSINSSVADGSVLVGRSAGQNITNGARNTVVGYQAMLDSVGAGDNAVLGYEALKEGTTSEQNVAVGSYSLGANAAAALTGNANTALGYKSMYVAQGTANSNTSVGGNSLLALTTGIQNVAVGTGAAGATTVGQQITAIGAYAMSVGNAGNYNTAVGNQSLTDVTGAANVAMGFQTAFNLTSGDYNVAIGHHSMGLGTVTGDHNVAVGHGSGYDLTSGEGNVFAGRSSGANVTSGIGNVLLGDQAGMSLVGGHNNVIIGREAGKNVTTTIQKNVIIGYTAGNGVLTTAADGLVAIGASAGTAITSGAANTVVGYESGKLLTTGASNVSVGYQAMGNAHLGSDKNVVIGRGAFYNGEVDEAVFIGFNAGGDGTTTTTANGTVGIGKSVLNNLTDGSANVAVGSNAGRNITGGDNNTILGYFANWNGGNVHQNTAVGAFALANAAGSNNTALGYNSGDVITSGTSNTILGYAADPSANSATNQTVIGATTTGVGDNSVTLGNADVTAIYAAQDSGATIYAAGLVEGSSMTLKENIAEIESPLDKLTKLRGVEFDYKSTKERSIGMIAEEVNEVFPELVNKNEDGEVTAMSYSRMTAVLLEAVKELSQEVKDSREEIRELKKLNNYSKAGDKN